MERHRHLLLLAVLIVSQVGMALVAPRHRSAQVLFDTLFAGAVLATLLLVFPTARARGIAAALLLPALLITAYRLVVAELGTGLALVFHVCVAAFIAFALAAILTALFRKRQVDGDHVLGAFAGYLLIAILWGNVYNIVYLADAQAFSLAADIRWELADWHQRRALFNFLGFATLSGLGYADVIPTAPISNTMTWLEVMTGQFYMAVVVATLVGMKVAQALTNDPPA